MTRETWTIETVFARIREAGFPGSNELNRMLQDIWNDGYDTGFRDGENEASR